MTWLATSLPVAQWLERLTGVLEVMCSIPAGDSDFSLPYAREKLNIPSFSFLSGLEIFLFFFFIITHGALDIADPSSMLDACHNELSKYDLARYETPSNSLVRVPDRCTGGHGFNSRRGLRFLPCPTLVRN